MMDDLWRYTESNTYTLLLCWSLLSFLFLLRKSQCPTQHPALSQQYQNKPLNVYGVLHLIAIQNPIISLCSFIQEKRNQKKWDKWDKTYEKSLEVTWLFLSTRSSTSPPRILMLDGPKSKTPSLQTIFPCSCSFAPGLQESATFQENV